MPAQDEKQLFNFNENFQRAVKSILATAGYHDAFIERSNQELPESRIEVSFALGEALNECARPDGSHEYDYFAGRLALRIVTFRPMEQPSLLPGVDSLHSEWAAAVLALMRLSKRPFTAENLPFYTVNTLRPLGTTADMETQWLQDFTRIEFAVEFGIRSDAWPQ